MSVKARCLNYTGCLLAYRGEVIEIAPGAPMVCPECGKTVSVTTAKGGSQAKLIGIAAAVVVVLALVIVLKPRLAKYFAPKQAEPQEEVIGGSSGPPATPLTPDSGSKITDMTTQPQPSVPVATPSSPAKIDLDLSKQENMKVRDEVLRRIDLMQITPQNKDKLYNSVQRAKKMGLVVTVPFSSGSSRIPANEVPALKTKLDAPDITKLREDPTCVFVVLGFADAQGDPSKNYTISKIRADSVMDAMKEKCNISNVMHAVAMGSSTLFDPKSLEKNRVVEIWAVLP